MGPSRRNSNGRSPLVNQQRQITSFFTKTPTPSPILSKSNPKLNPNPIPNPNLTTPSPLNPKSHKPLLVIGASPSPSTFGEEVVGKRIKVYWPLDNAWYEGIVKSFDNVTSKHLVCYDDDEEECVDLSKEKIEWPNPKDSSTKKLKRLRRGSSPLRKMVIDEENEVDESIKEEEEEEEHDSDDSEDEDWGKNAVLEDAGDDDEEKDMELEDEDDVAERVKGKPSCKVELKKRKLGGAQKQEPNKKIKSGMEVNKGAFKLSVSEPVNNLEGK